MRSGAPYFPIISAFYDAIEELIVSKDAVDTALASKDNRGANIIKEAKSTSHIVVLYCSFMFMNNIFILTYCPSPNNVSVTVVSGTFSRRPPPQRLRCEQPQIRIQNARGIQNTRPLKAIKFISIYSAEVSEDMTHLFKRFIAQLPSFEPLMIVRPSIRLTSFCG